MATDSNFHQSSSGVRTYRGRTFGEILPQIRSELGPDAVILREREGLVGGIGGFFAQRFIEVDARPGEPRPVTTRADEPGADRPTGELGGRPAPLGRRFETAAFIDRLREASAALRDDDIVELRSTREPATPTEPPKASTPPRPIPATPVSMAQPEPGYYPELERETMTKVKSKPKRKAKEKGSSKHKGKSKGKAQVKAQESRQPPPSAPARPMAQAWAGWAAQPDATRPAAAPAPAPAWDAEAEPTPQPESRATDERPLEGLRRFLPDVIVAALLLIVLGPRRYRSSRHAAWRAPCPVCGRRGDGSTLGPYGRSGVGRPRFPRPRYSDFPCQCR